jgi:diaminopimelate decarboxylase
MISSTRTSSGQTVELPWWAEKGFEAPTGGLMMGGRYLAELAAEHGTPLYVYNTASVRRRLSSLRAALTGAGLDRRIYYAMKANRHPLILQTIRRAGDVGVDACSPREVALALEAGFRPAEISVTAGMLSNRDLDFFTAHGVQLNLDSVSAVRRYGDRAPRGTRVGLRLDPHSWSQGGDQVRLAYGGGKLGLAPEQFEVAASTAAAAGLVVDTLHVHCGWGLQASALPFFKTTLAHLVRLARTIPTVETINVGGGLSVMHQPAETPLAVADWAAALREELAPSGLRVACEPGTFVVADAGVLVVEVNTVETKQGITWLGVDAGHNVNLYPALYGLPLTIVHVARPFDPPAQRFAIAGNINEPNDVFGRDVPLPLVREGEFLALLPTGAYGASMASDHCLRGGTREIAI